MSWVKIPFFIDRWVQDSPAPDALARASAGQFTGKYGLLAVFFSFGS